MSGSEIAAQVVNIRHFRHTVHMAGAWKRIARAHARGIAAAIATTALLLAGVSASGTPAAASDEVAPSSSVVAPTLAGSDSAAGVVKAADLSKFQAGNIITDAVFFSKSTMTEAQIQTFLQQKVSTCKSGYTCLKDYYDTARTISGDAMCGAYAGGSRERASRIIYKVAQACGINPQVILVMLQKEQGLVTSTAPSSWNYQAAMGQGCPDTAACDSRYYGLFNQVYWGAWQMKRYANPPGTSQYFTWYAPGKTWNVRWHPNAACGSSPVYIQNQATSNLYYYTPYQPNAAALRAGYGTGDGCSSYGNRNFYQYFTDWFGSTQRNPAAEIEAEYLAQGGAAGLGEPITGVNPLYENGGGFGRAYARGSIYWTYTYGAKTVREGRLRDYYFARAGADGDVGWPVLNQETLTLSTGNGIAQLFSGGSLYSGAFGTFIVREPVRTGYFSMNGAAGPLGWPKADQLCSAGICRQEFAAGSVISSLAGAFPVLDPVRAEFDVSGGVGTWGAPLTGVNYLPYFGGGYGQAFAMGSAYYLPGGRAYFVSGAIRDRYFSLGGAAGWLGFPIGVQQCADAATCQQQFQYGWIMWTASGGTRIGDPAIDSAYAAQGGSGGTLGARTSPFVYYSFNGGGFAEGFANGAIFYKRSVGAAYAVSGTVRDAYFAAGGAAGRFGWPTSGMTCTASTCSQGFEGGTITAAR